ncbi:dihydroorotate dehydrogenase electron transfer subunit [Erysipelothrix urinaevulpis]|uniref:dihydroorotate dehydrogenase electron transfer subunit n=1 Tax=Erysipelothrix urinaevulpis TaxID=2683717 RepID=UPI001357BEB4|nr:dihydroorotate dehydrogenase electron transfer subunit [Erysipelothrix urinaevulpis]
MKVEMMRILANHKIAEDTYELILEGDIARLIKEPGQFVHLKLNDDALPLRRPISISSYHQNTMTLLYKVVGKGTLALSKLTIGDDVDVLGPLGNGFKLGPWLKNKKVLIVGAGIGIAPLYQLAKELQAYDVDLDISLSFQHKNAAYYVKEFQELGTVYISSDDGSVGFKGYASDLLKTLGKNYDLVYSCGPKVVLSFVQSYYEKTSEIYLSLEERMGCGIGACYACDTKDKTKRICKDGPVFNGKEVLI